MWNRLTEPSSVVKEPDRCRQSRLLSTSLLIVFVVLSMGIATMRLVPRMALYSANQDLVLGLSVLAFLIVTYVVNRAGYYTPAAVIAILAPEIGIFAATAFLWLGKSRYYADDDVNLLVYTVMPLVYASMLLSVRALIGILVFNAAMMLILPFFFSHIALSDIIVGPLLFSFVISALVLLVVRQRNRLEEDRQAELVR